MNINRQLSPPIHGCRVVLAGLGALLHSPQARTHSSPEGSMRLLVPFTLGFDIDLIARAIRPILTSRLKRPFYVENKPGASGNIGAQKVVSVAPDGSTLLLNVNTLVMNRVLYPKAGFDLHTDLAPVSLTNWGKLILVASRISGIDSLQAFMTRARAKPSVLNYGSPRANTPHHLTMELLMNRAKVFLPHISYRGTAQAVNDILGGQIDKMLLKIHVVLQQVRADGLNAQAISLERRAPLLPSIRPLRTLNIGGLNVDIWYGVLAPALKPRPQI